MRNRYFSPDSASLCSTGKPNQDNKLRWVGSMTKLPSMQFPKDQQNIKRIGDSTYELQKQIGSGYSSKVFRAVKLSNQSIQSHENDTIEQQPALNNQFYAIKVIQLKKCSSSNTQMLENEIRILRMLDHPNVIRCYDVQKTYTHCFIVTEYCPNGDLLQHLTRKGRISETAAAEIISDIVEGYKYLVKKGIVHRDLKPANILNGDSGWKIADFGFSIESEMEMKSRYNVGTPLYMPIESLVNNLYSVKSDIFAIGVIYFELLVGTTPWQCKTEKQLIKKLSSLSFRIPEKFNSRLSRNVKELLMKMCAVNSKQRMSKETFLQTDVMSYENPEERISNSTTLKTALSTGRLQIPSTPKLDLSNNLKLDMDQARMQLQVQKVLLTNRGYKSAENINFLKLNSANSKSTQEDDKKVQQKQESVSNHILVNQLHFCRFLYYLIKNSDHFCIVGQPKDRFCLVLFKHLLKLIKQLADSTVNWFRLENWNSFRNSKKYGTTLTTMKDYLQRYEKEYLSFLKKVDIAVIRDINRQLHSFAGSGHMSTEFIKQLVQYIAPIIREYNHNLSRLLHESSYTLNPQLKASIHGLYSIHKYRQVLLVCAGPNHLNFSEFEKEADIKVHVDYKNVPNWCLLEDYVNLRKELKFI